MNKARERTLATWEAKMPDLVRFCARDLEFLLTIEKLDSTPPEDEHGARTLLERAWSLDRARLSVELDDDRFTRDVSEAREFLHRPEFEEYKSRFGRYITEG